METASSNPGLVRLDRGWARSVVISQFGGRTTDHFDRVEHQIKEQGKNLIENLVRSSRVNRAIAARRPHMRPISQRDKFQPMNIPEIAKNHV